MKSESEVAQSFPTLSDPWTAAYQAPPSRGFSRQEYWSGEPLPSPVFFCYRSFPPFSLPIFRNVIIDSCIFLKNKIDNLYLVHKDPWPVFLFLLVTLSQNPSVGGLSSWLLGPFNMILLSTAFSGTSSYSSWSGQLEETLLPVPQSSNLFHSISELNVTVCCPCHCNVTAPVPGAGLLCPSSRSVSLTSPLSRPASWCFLWWMLVSQRREVAQSCPTLCNPMDQSLPVSSIHGIFQARVLEWVAISFSSGSSQPRDRTQVSRIGGRHFIVWATREALC